MIEAYEAANINNGPYMINFEAMDFGFYDVNSDGLDDLVYSYRFETIVERGAFEIIDFTVAPKIPQKYLLSKDY